LLPGVPELHMSEVSICEGELEPVHEKPTDGYWQPWTLESCPQLDDIQLTQQYSVLPLPGVPALQTRDVSLCSGVSLPVHE
jgi:hypothetical protein